MHSLRILQSLQRRASRKVLQINQTASISVRTVEKPKNKDEEVRRQLEVLRDSIYVEFFLEF